MKNNQKNNKFDDLDDSDIFLDSGKSCPTKTMFIWVIVLFIVILAGYFCYKSYSNNEYEEVIIISADENEDDNKAQPLDPGGMVVSNMDKDVYDSIDKTSKKNKAEVEVLLPPSEEPVDKKELTAKKVEEAKSDDNDASAETPKKVTAKNEDYIKPVTQTKSKKKNKFTKKPEKFYKVQIASFKSKKDAEKQWDLLSKRYKKLLSPYEHYIVSKDIEGKGIFQRLQVGPFENEAAARKACSEFKDTGLNCFIIKP